MSPANAPKQLPLEFPHRPALGSEDFLVAPCNTDAVSWIDRYPDWTAPVLLLCGPKGAGKSHLANVFRARTGAVVISADALKDQGPDQVLAGAQAFVLEDVDTLVASGLEDTLFHLYNLAREQGLHILMTAKTPPHGWTFGLKDLSSRLRAAPVAEIKTPDDALLAALIVKQASDRNMKISGDVLNYVLPRMERSFGAVGQFVADLDRLSLAEKRAVTVPLARRVLDGA